jgi:hypothetical protein
MIHDWAYRLIKVLGRLRLPLHVQFSSFLLQERLGLLANHQIFFDFILTRPKNRNSGERIIENEEPKEKVLILETWRLTLLFSCAKIDVSERCDVEVSDR